MIDFDDRGTKTVSDKFEVVEDRLLSKYDAILSLKSQNVTSIKILTFTDILKLSSTEIKYQCHKKTGNGTFSSIEEVLLQLAYDIDVKDAVIPANVKVIEWNNDIITAK